MVASRFKIEDLLPIGMTIIVLGIGLAYGLEVMGDIQQDQCANTWDGGCFKCPTNYANYNSSAHNCYNATGSHTARLASSTVTSNATQDSIDAVAKIPKKLGMIVTVVIAAVIIGILINYLWFRKQ